MTFDQFWFTPGPDYLYPDDNPLGIFTLPHLIWDASGGKGGIPYIIAFTVFTCIVMHLAYFVYRVISVKRRKA